MSESELGLEELGFRGRLLGEQHLFSHCRRQRLTGGAQYQARSTAANFHQICHSSLGVVLRGPFWTISSSSASSNSASWMISGKNIFFRARESGPHRQPAGASDPRTSPSGRQSLAVPVLQPASAQCSNGRAHHDPPNCGCGPTKTQTACIPCHQTRHRVSRAEIRQRFFPPAPSREKEKIESMLFLNLPPKTDGSAAQIRRGPAMRFNFLLKNRCTPCACSAEPPCRKARRICAAITAGVVLTRAAQA